MSDQQSYSGLGYSRGSNSTRTAGTISTTRTSTATGNRDQQYRVPSKNSTTGTGTAGTDTSMNTTSNSTNGIDDLMASYMQQCLQYHHDQSTSSIIVEPQPQQQEEETNATTAPLHMFVSPTTHSAHEHVYDYTPRDSAVIPLDDHVDKSTTRTDETARSSSPTVDIDTRSTSTTTTATATVTTAKDADTDVKSNPEFQKALAKAKAIAQRIATGDGNGNTSSGSGIATTTTTPTSSISISISTPHPYAQRRHEFLTKHHAKLNSFLLQNFQYLAERDEAQLQRQLHHLNSFQQHHQKEEQQKQKQQQQQQQQEKKRKHAPNLAGIGSQSRRKHGNGNASSSSTSCGVYITGLPQSQSTSSTSTSTSTKEEEEQELIQILQQIFESFGKVSNVKLYHNKMEMGGGRKGDGLILYDWDVIRHEKLQLQGEQQQQQHHQGQGEMDRMRLFLEMVCQQLNGVELPCGTVLNAEPAELNYKQKKRSNSGVGGSGRVDASHNGDDINGNNENVNVNTPGDGGVIAKVGGDKKEDECGKDPGEADEDLDDFFASLE